jgi:RNA polymerase sigma-70 factor (ECF subfamily)
MHVMGEADWLAEQFEASRPRLSAVAYRMLGSRTEAEDAVQEAWLRLDRSDTEQIDNLGGWLTTVVARLCLDRLRARRSRPESPFAEHEPMDLADAAVVDPAQQALMAESVGAALLVVLDSLAPAERVAFVLHDVFAVPFDEIGEIVGRSPDATRQLASRARRRVQGTATTADVDPLRQRTLVDAFLRAARGGDFEGLLKLLDPEVVLQPDEAAVRMGSLRETRGAEAVAGALSGGAQTAALALVDGLAALVWAPGGRTRGVIEFTVAGDRIVSIRVTGDAERIGELDIVVLDS